MLEFKLCLDTGNLPPICCQQPVYGFHKSKIMTKQIADLEVNSPFYLLLVFADFIVNISCGLRQILNHFVNCNVLFIGKPFLLFLERLL